MAAAGPLPLEAAREPGHDPGDGAPGRQAVLPAAGVDVAVAAAGEPAREGDRDEGGAGLLPDAVPGLRVEAPDDGLAAPGRLLDSRTGFLVHCEFTRSSFFNENADQKFPYGNCIWNRTTLTQPLFPFGNILFDASMPVMYLPDQE